MRCLWVLTAAGLCATAARAQPLSRVRASIATKGDIWVGQRVTLVVDLLTPGFFSSAPAFDLPTVSGVILVPPQDRPVVGSETVDGTSYTTQRHELAAFAQRAGKVEIPGFSVRFESSEAFGKPAAEQRVTTPAVAFEARMPPGAEGLATVITTPELTVKEAWEPQPGSGPVKPGAAFTRTITVEARDVPGMVLPAFRFDAPEGLKAYPKPAAVEDRTERGAMTGRRVESVTYVCEKAGTASLPALVLAWWDSSEQKLKRVELPGRTFEVAATPQPPTAAPQPAPDPRRAWAWVVGALAVGVAAWWLVPAVWGWWQRYRAAAAESEATYFAAFERTCRTGDARATQRALLAWLDRFLADDPAPNTESFAARSADPALAAELTKLEDAVYGRTASRGRPWSAEELVRRTRAARSRLRQDVAAGNSRGGALPPLNPCG
jgi:hypothetical protein